MSDIIVTILGIVTLSLFIDFLLRIKENIQFKREQERLWQKYINEDKK